MTQYRNLKGHLVREPASVQSGGAIVILAERPKEDMELDLRKQRIKTYCCRIICR